MVAVAVEADEAIDDGMDPLDESSRGTAPQNNDKEQPSIGVGHYLKKGLLNEDEALEIILKGGSGFASPRISNSSSVVGSPALGSYLTTKLVLLGYHVIALDNLSLSKNSLSHLFLYEN